MKSTNVKRRSASGFTLLDVLLAIAVFAFGMLALVQLQTGLARSSSDANTRTVAGNIAEEIVERARGFTQIAADAGNGRIDYDEVVSYDAPETRAVGRQEYTVNLNVNEYYWDADSESFTDVQPAGVVNSDLKTMDIVVAWRELQDGESFEDHDSINFSEGGALRIVEVLPSAPSLLGALLAATKEVGGTPPVSYTPGENPDIVALKLFESEDGTFSKFKESTTATPDVIRDQKVETWFDVVTYSQAEGDAVFLRREEFVAVSCECELNNSPSEADWGLKPTLWNGATYTEGEKVSKPIGIAPNGVQQSPYCSVCCRDHHDGGGTGAEDVYNVANAGGSNSDHPHYDVDNRGDLIETPVESGDRYVEACRLVRKDGFMRVTQDAKQSVLLGFPEGYLEFTPGVEIYSGYVTAAVEDAYGGVSQQPLPKPGDPGYEDYVYPGVSAFPARHTDDATDLPTGIFADNQQLRARAVYTDYLTTEARQVLSDCFPEANQDCPVPYVSSPLEIYPFFDLQMTLISRWVDRIGNNLVTVTNEPIQTNNLHNRGLTQLVTESVQGQAEIGIESHSGNLGLTATGPIDPEYDISLNHEVIFVDTNNDSTPVPPIGVRVSGGLSSGVRRVPAADLLLESSGALCGQTDTEWSCIVPTGGLTLTVSNYYLNNPRVYVCSDLIYRGEGDDLNSTSFELPGTPTTADIWVTDDPTDCGSR